MSILLNRTDKKTIRDFNIEEARGWVLDRANQLERKINSIIIKYIQPSKNKNQFMDEIILNPSNITFGNKIKIINAIQSEIIKNKKGLNKETKSSFKQLANELRKLCSIRNAFAHCIILDVYGINLGIDKNTLSKLKYEKQVKDSAEVDIKEMFPYMTIHVVEGMQLLRYMKADGTITSKRYYSLLSEFYDHFHSCKNTLTNIYDNI
jgi:hypothetical protein